MVTASDPLTISALCPTFDKGRVGSERGADISSLRWQAHSTFIAGCVLFIVCNPGTPIWVLALAYISQNVSLGK